MGVIAGIGGCLPGRSLDNEDVIRTGALDTTDDWIRTRTGIARRRRVTAGTSTGDLATAAGRAAVASAGERPDFVLLATTTPDHPCPATAPAVAHRLGLGEVPAFDLAAVCSGFLYALITADALLRSGLCHTPLVIGADTYSTIVDPHDRDTAALFGDGAGAVVLRTGHPGDPGAILAADQGSDGAGHDLITVPGGGSRHPPHHPDTAPEARFFRMRGRAVYAQAVRRMTGSARTAIDRAGWTTHDVRAFIGHQANQRILDAVADRLDIAPHRRFGNIREIGNTAAASIPLVLADPTVHTSLTPGAPTVLTAFGGGLTWASVALTWPEAPPHHEPAPARPS
ncbi:beta-ketoacyl-ACP synthase III [Streptomyces sp. NPDC051567]|uniref:beta-ketoacyl-ACP synthase III n=1 Tax=Streptomyces sp. NPDC051567 TaxID=3365660 RepID=UPI0037BA3509